MQSDRALTSGERSVIRSLSFFTPAQAMPFTRIPLLILQIGLILAWSSGYVGAIIAAETDSVVRVLVWRFIGVALLFSPFLIHAIRRGITWRWCALHALLGVVGMF